MLKKFPRAPSADMDLPLLTRPEAITLLLEGVRATAFTFADPTVTAEVRMLEELREDLLGAVDVWPRLGAVEQQGVKEALAEHLERLEVSGWALSGGRQDTADGAALLRFHALRRTGRAPRGLLH